MSDGQGQPTTYRSIQGLRAVAALLVDPHVTLLLYMLVPVVVGIAVHYGFERPVNRRVASLLLGRRSSVRPAAAVA